MSRKPTLRCDECGKEVAIALGDDGFDLTAAAGWFELTSETDADVMVHACSTPCLRLVHPKLMQRLGARPTIAQYAEQAPR